MKERKRAKMTNIEAMHSFLEDRSSHRDRQQDYNGINDPICVRFIRKKFKCLIIFFLTLCVLGETLIMTFDKINFDKVNDFYAKIFKENATDILS